MLDMEALESAGIDTEEGIAYCADDPEFYEEMILEFLKESEGRISDLERYYTGRDWHGYTVCAHSVKSSSRMIGAAKLSEDARIMEMAGREANKEMIPAGHMRFLEAYRNTVEKLRAAVAAEGGFA